ncbi:hypothetical protein [Mycobacterium sp.]|uniref:hypothetical protein n=1 Tax=Mycobacterium sp. TaxID=1785 RepID=UPI00262C422D|nr:hypothetical protein [Mycobacterium sp.]
MPQLATALPVTLGETNKTLPVVRVAITQKLVRLDLGRMNDPIGRVASESVEITLRAAEGDVADMFSGSAADPVPYARIRLGDQDVEAMFKLGEPCTNGFELDLVFLLLRVAPHAIQFGDDWELDDERSYSHDGVTVQVVRPKQKLRLRDNR